MTSWPGQVGYVLDRARVKPLIKLQSVPLEGSATDYRLIGRQGAPYSMVGFPRRGKAALRELSRGSPSLDSVTQPLE